MSFYCNNYHPESCPGTITSNPLNGICEKTCVQVKKVFDACIKQITDEGIAITLTDPVGTAPFTFISAKSVTSQGAVTNLTVDVIDNCKNLSRVKSDIVIPLEVIYVDAAGTEQRGASSITLPEDVIMCLPEASIMPYQIEAVVSCVCPDGTYTSGASFNVNACITIILKVVIEVELLIPSYGYCPIPPCQEYTQEVCAGFFELPLFPKTPNCCKK